MKGLYMPTVSVIIPSYNHEKFIQECIQSVLAQTFQDFEIIITDDASTDNTVEIIRSFDDTRIKVFTSKKNQGASVTANNCISHSSGKYIAMLSSDDTWYPEKLETQVAYLEQHSEIAAVFGKADWVDESGQIIRDKTFPHMDVFNVKNRSRFAWLRYFFYHGNCLCHPCSLVRRECYDEVGMFNPAFANLPDFDLWVKICLRHEIRILDRKLIRFRRIQGETNVSSDTNKSRVRNRFEHRQILNEFLKITDPDEFLLIFPDASNYGNVTADTIPFILGQLAIKSGTDFMVLWGLDLIYTLLQNKDMVQLLEQNYSFTYRDFIELSGSCDPFRISILFPTTLSSSVVKQNLFGMLWSVSRKYAKDIYLIFVRSFSK
jgi:glycosyltransferase involved in cell wall biosynthesis